MDGFRWSFGRLNTPCLQFKLNDLNRSQRLLLHSAAPPTVEAFLHVRIVTSNVNCATEIVVVAISLTQACTQRQRRSVGEHVPVGRVLRHTHAPTDRPTDTARSFVSQCLPLFGTVV